MATTTLLQRHAGEGETIAEAIRDCLDYGKNPEKTESGKYISAYECDPATVVDEFLLAKASYAAMTGREQKKANDVLCYQIRQSFYPGEITPKEANRIGYELAMRWTKGRHASQNGCAEGGRPQAHSKEKTALWRIPEGTTGYAGDRHDQGEH